MTSRSPRRRMLSISAGIGVAVLVSSVAASMPGEKVSAATGTITGRLFYDGGADGKFDNSDTGVGGQVVKAYDSTGALVGSDVTNPTSTRLETGLFELEIASAATSRIRVEFPTLVGHQSSIVNSAAGSAGSSIQFVELGATDVNYGIFVPENYCQATMSLASVCINQGSTDPTAIKSASRALGLSSFEPEIEDPEEESPIAKDQSAAAVTTLSTHQQVGATWGLGWQKSNRYLWNSAVVRRHAALGPKGLGGVYVHDLQGNLVKSFDLAAAPTSLVLGTAADYTESARDIVATGRTPTTLSKDLPAFAGVGVDGLGDLDISQDSQYMWVTNLHERKIHRIAITGTGAGLALGAVQSWEVDKGHTCTQPTLRPWGLETNPDGTVYVAAVCTNETTTPSTSTLAGGGVILKLDPTKPNDVTAWTKVTDVSFAQAHNYDNCSQSGMTCTWKAWSSDWAAIKAVGRPTGNNQPTFWWTQPMIVDIEQMSDGSFVLGVSDRFSYQGGNNNYYPIAQPGTNDLMTSWVAGDTLLLCKKGAAWIQESQGKCEGDNTFKNPTYQPKEFFVDEYGHPETTIGGLALGRGQVAVAAMDPAEIYLSGVRWVSTVNGMQTNALNMTGKDVNGGSGGFGKAAGMGDLEALCDAAPLQIGNRVWYDDNHDGIQDAGEGPVVGVTVRLYDATNVLVGTAITNASGEYYFTSTTVESADGGATPDAFGGGLAVNTNYTVVLDNPDDCLAGKPLDGFILTFNDKTTTDGPPERDNLIDSDAVSSGVSWCGAQAATVTVTPMSVGGVNHSYDIGFWKEGHISVWPDPSSPVPAPTQPSVPGEGGSSSNNNSSVSESATQPPSSTLKVSVGDYVWWDLDRDGIQDKSDIPIPGVTLTIKKADGSAVTDVNGKPVTTTVTDANGKYSFDDLPPGQYVVTVTPPEGGIATKAGAGKNRAKDSSTGSATSVVLVTDGQRDPTLDFGFYRPSVSVGNYVWRDVKGDGTQNISDKGLAGFTLTVRKFAGGTVTDVYGRPVGSVRSKSDGKYLFEHLPAGRYVVKITYPRGYVPTTADRPDRKTNSSTAMALSRALKAGQSDLTLDFGVVSRPGERYRALPSTF